MSVFSNLVSREVDNAFLVGKRQAIIQSSTDLLKRLQVTSILSGHSGCVNSVLFSDDGNTIFSGSDDMKINTYSVSDGRLINSFKTIHTNNIFYAKELSSFYPNIIISCAADGRVVCSGKSNDTCFSMILYRLAWSKLGFFKSRVRYFFK